MNGPISSWARLIFALSLMIAVTAKAGDAAKGFDAFRSVKARNVFDPDRHAMRGEAPPPAVPPANRPNFLTLTGTMVAEGKMLAFFSGSQTPYNKVVPVGESVADFKITAITNTQVEMERDGKAVVLAVGKQMPMEGTAAPSTPAPEAVAPTVPTPTAENIPAPEPAPANDPAPAGAEPADAKPTDPAPAGETSDVIRRMMERRQKELTK